MLSLIRKPILLESIVIASDPRSYFIRQLAFETIRYVIKRVIKHKHRKQGRFVLSVSMPGTNYPRLVFYHINKNAIHGIECGVQMAWDQMNAFLSQEVEEDIFERYFDPSHVDRVRRRFQRVLDETKFLVIVYMSEPYKNNGTIALGMTELLGVDNHEAPIVLLNMHPHAFDIQCKKRYVSTIVHELTHFYFGTVDFAYDRDACLKLAKTNPEKAFENAENYALFVCDLLSTNMKSKEVVWIRHTDRIASVYK